MRLFVGIEFPSEVVAALVKCQEQLRCLAVKGRFKRSENFHLTLKFLGEVELRLVPDLVAAMNNIAQSTSPFSLRLGRLGKFGLSNPIRVVWLDVEDAGEHLRKLQGAVEEALVNWGFKAENRRWQPHITLAQDVAFATGDALSRCQTDDIAFRVNEFALILSEERDRRRVYTALQRFSLLKAK